MSDGPRGRRGPFDPPAEYVVSPPPRVPRVWHDPANGNAAYLITAAGRWRVYDGRLIDGKFREGTWNPSHRVFVAEDGSKRIAALRDGEPKHVDERYLVGQLERAEAM